MILFDDRKRTIIDMLDLLQHFEESGEWEVTPTLRSMVQSHLGLPSVLIDKVITNPFIMQQVILSIWDSNRMVTENYRSLMQRIVRAGYDIDKSQKYIRLRFFDPAQSSFFGTEFFKNDTAYVICDDIPVLFVQELADWLLEARPGGNELNWITRPELRGIFALSFGADYGYRIFKTLDKVIDSKLRYFTFDPFAHENRDKVVDIFRTLKRMLTQDDSLKVIFSSRYKFDSEKSTYRISRLYDSFDIDSRLHLRTALHFVKAASLLWGSNQFAEEAFSNMYFGLEGVLRMIHHRTLGNMQFEIKRTLERIEQEFPGKMFAEEISDFYEHRIELVHPEPDFEADWERFYCADDLLDSFAMIRALLVFAFCGDKIET